MFFFSTPDEANGEKLWTAFSAVPKILKRQGYEHLASSCSFVWEVHPKQGKYAGMYKHSKKPEVNPHRVIISADDSTIDKSSIASYAYVLLHELCHVWHFQILDRFTQLNAQWIQLFHTSIAARFVKTDRSQAILKKLLKAASLKTVLDEADEELKADLKLLIKWLKEFRNITSRELEVLLKSASDSSIASLEEIWPRVTIRSKKLKPLVSEYSCKNYREFFAESCTFFLLGKELPKEITALVEKSLSKANQNYKLAEETV